MINKPPLPPPPPPQGRSAGGLKRPPPPQIKFEGFSIAGTSCLRRPAGFSLSGSTALVLEPCLGQKVAINRGGGGGFGKVFFFSRAGALLEEASAFKKYFEPGPRPARVAINQRGFINQELTL